MTTPSAQPPDKPQYDPQVLVQLAKIERAAVFPYMQRRNRLLPHSCFRSVGPRRRCRCGGLRHKGDKEKLPTHSEPCRPFLRRSLRPLYGPKARVTVLGPRMRGFH